MKLRWKIVLGAAVAVTLLACAEQPAPAPGATITPGAGIQYGQQGDSLPVTVIGYVDGSPVVSYCDGPNLLYFSKVKDGYSVAVSQGDVRCKK